MGLLIPQASPICRFQKRWPLWAAYGDFCNEGNRQEARAHLFRLWVCLPNVMVVLHARWCCCFSGRKRSALASQSEAWTNSVQHLNNVSRSWRGGCASDALPRSSCRQGYGHTSHSNEKCEAGHRFFWREAATIGVLSCNLLNGPVLQRSAVIGYL